MPLHSLLTSDELLLIAQHLDEPCDLCAFSAVNRACRATDLNLVWFDMCRQAFRDYSDPDFGDEKNLDWKMVYEMRDNPLGWYAERPAWLDSIAYVAQYPWRAIAASRRRALTVGGDDTPSFIDCERVPWSSPTFGDGGASDPPLAEVWVTAQVVWRGAPCLVGHTTLATVAKHGHMRLSWKSQRAAQLERQLEQDEDARSVRSMELIVDLSYRGRAVRITNSSLLEGHDDGTIKFEPTSFVFDHEDLHEDEPDGFTFTFDVATPRLSPNYKASLSIGVLVDQNGFGSPVQISTLAALLRGGPGA